MGKRAQLSDKIALQLSKILDLPDAAAKLDPNYTLINRLQSEWKQATERCEGYSNQLREKAEIIHKLL